MKAMILAAGRGERMRPLTDTCPKPLLMAGGKPLVVRHIERLRAAGCTEIIINHAHLGHLIEAALGDGARYGVSIQYSAEQVALETAGGICAALPLLGEHPFLVINGDVYCDADLVAFQRTGNNLNVRADLAHLLLVANPEHNPEGDFILEHGRVLDVVSNTAKLTFSGIGIYHPALFSALVRGDKAPLAPLLRAAMADGHISGSLHQGYWIDVGTPQRLTQLDQHLRTHMAAQR